MVMKTLKTLIALAFIAAGMTSCIDDEEPMRAAPARDAEVRVAVRFVLPSSKAGDPGTGHDEFEADWGTIAFYFVYDNGQVLTQAMGREELAETNTFLVYEGNVTAYVATFPEGEEPVQAASADEVRNMATAASVNLPSNADERKRHLLSYFSGISGQTEVVKEEDNHIDVMLDRLVSKVDLQWDVQPGIDGGAFVSAQMSSITFVGYGLGHVFPSAATEPLGAATMQLATLDGNVSERNGRAYFYTFPGEGCGFRFDIAFDGAGDGAMQRSYAATFDDAIAGDAWHKVNLTVRGTSVNETSDPVPITLTPNQ